MGRAPRAEYPGATYHVFARGTRKTKIFHDAWDYHSYVEDLRKVSAEEGVAVISFCLMPNHPHLCVQTNGSPLSVFMQRLNTRHARRFNWRHQTTGHLHEGRYRALLVQTDPYLLRLVRYIHQNPVRAHLTVDPSDWPHSSFGEYLLPSSWVSREDVLERLGSVKNFADFMRSPPEDDDHLLFTAPRRGFRLAGTSEFASVVASELEGIGADLRKWHPRSRAEWRPSEPAREVATQWLDERAGALSISDLQSEALCEPLRSTRRELALHLRALRYSLDSIGEVLGRDCSAVSRMLSRKRLTNDKT